MKKFLVLTLVVLFLAVSCASSSAQNPGDPNELDMRTPHGEIPFKDGPQSWRTIGGHVPNLPNFKDPEERAMESGQPLTIVYKDKEARGLIQTLTAKVDDLVKRMEQMASFRSEVTKSDMDKVAEKAQQADARSKQASDRLDKVEQDSIAQGQKIKTIDTTVGQNSKDIESLQKSVKESSGDSNRANIFSTVALLLGLLIMLYLVIKRP